MPSERIQRQIDRLLDEADQAMALGDWETVRLRAAAALRLDRGNADAAASLDAAREEPASSRPDDAEQQDEKPSVSPLPESFVGGRYRVTGLLGEGGKKVVYRAHDTLLDRDVAFALIKTDGLEWPGASA